MITKQEKKKIALLNALKDENGPVNSKSLARTLAAAGHDLSERSIRMYLAELDAEQLTRPCGRRGRVITESGCNLLRSSEITQSTGRLSAKIDQMTYRMDFNLADRSGKVVVNTSVVDPEIFRQKLPQICQVFTKGFAMGDRACLLQPGEEVSGLRIPPGRVGFCTVCSITINGVMLKHGVPTASRFGGLLEIRGGKARQFAEIIDYEGTTIDPLEIFIRSGMTDYLGAIRDGNGRIGAGFREYPEDSRPMVLQLAGKLAEAGLGAFLEIGLPGQPVLGIPVSAGRFGAIVAGGLNPVSIIEESGHRVESRALSGLLEYSRFYPSQQLAAHLY